MDQVRIDLLGTRRSWLVDGVAVGVTMPWGMLMGIVLLLNVLQEPVDRMPWLSWGARAARWGWRWRPAPTSRRAPAGGRCPRWRWRWGRSSASWSPSWPTGSGGSPATSTR
ncbi:MAG: hypothetical protein R3F59_04165 [Myxococcota bacterium]